MRDDHDPEPDRLNPRPATAGRTTGGDRLWRVHLTTASGMAVEAFVTRATREKLHKQRCYYYQQNGRHHFARGQAKCLGCGASR